MIPIWVHVNENPDAHGAMIEFLSSRIWGDGRKINADTIMGVADGENIIAGVAFHNYDATQGVIEVSAASETPRWLTRPILKALFDYPFDQLGCGVVVARIDPDNKRLDRIFTAYGFSKHVIPDLRGKGKAEVVLTLTDDAWRANGFHKR